MGQQNLYRSVVLPHGSPLERGLLAVLAVPSSLERARSVLCGLEFRYCLHPSFGLLRGTPYGVFYAAAEKLIHEKKLTLF